MTRINLLSSPRNISTALMYSFANRPDTEVVDEPLYAYYLSHTGKKHPAWEEIIASQLTNSQKVLEALKSNRTRDVLFIKNMAHHYIDIDSENLEGFKNVFLIRNPYQLIASFAQVIEHPEMLDIGVKKQFELFDYLRAKNENPIVLDSNQILQNPKKVLGELCEKLEISDSEEMYNWPAGAIEADGVWAKYWYKNVHNSTGFSPQKTSQRILPDHLKPLYLEAKEYYEEMFKHSIKA